MEQRALREQEPQPELTDEERREAAEKQKAEGEALLKVYCEALEMRWKKRREALFRRRAAEKRLKRRGRWPPAD